MRKLTLALLFVTALGLALPAEMRIAVGHAEYDRSVPAADAVVDIAPTQVQIWFTQEIFRRQGVNSIEVASADGTRVDLDDTAIDDDDRKLMNVSLASDLAAGVYTVRWRALSAEDGHEGQGEFRFTIETAAMPAPAATGTLTDTINTTNTTTVTETATAVVSVTVETAVSPTSTLLPPTAGPTSTVPISAGPVATVSPTSAPAPSSNLQCFGTAMPLALVLGAVVVRRRRHL